MWIKEVNNGPGVNLIDGGVRGQARLHDAWAKSPVHINRVPSRTRTGNRLHLQAKRVLQVCIGQNTFNTSTIQKNTSTQRA